MTVCFLIILITIVCEYTIQQVIVVDKSYSNFNKIGKPKLFYSVNITNLKVVSKTTDMILIKTAVDFI